MCPEKYINRASYLRYLRLKQMSLTLSTFIYGDDGDIINAKADIVYVKCRASKFKIK